MYLSISCYLCTVLDARVLGDQSKVGQCNWFLVSFYLSDLGTTHRSPFVDRRCCLGPVSFESLIYSPSHLVDIVNEKELHTHYFISAKISYFLFCSPYPRLIDDGEKNIDENRMS